MPQQIRAVVVDPAVPGRLAIREVGLRDPDRDEVGVRDWRTLKRCPTFNNQAAARRQAPPH